MKKLAHIIQRRRQSIHPVLLSCAALACLVIAPTLLAVDPPPDGGYSNQKTAEGEDALFSAGGLTFASTAVGYHALYNDGLGQNTAVGSEALTNVSNGFWNTGIGQDALHELVNGTGNTALGMQALYSCVFGKNNVAIGLGAAGSTNGSDNIAIGNNALRGTDGDNNIVIGNGNGINLTTGSDNIVIGSLQTRVGEAATIRIGQAGKQTATYISGIYGAVITADTAVVVSKYGKLGVMASSKRFKKAIHPMEKASEAILSLQPVTFRYKTDDPEAEGMPQFGLIAEDVAEVAPDLVIRDEDGTPLSVRYQQVNAMLLNEFLKAHARIEQLEAAEAEHAATLAEQKKQIEALTATLEKHESTIRAVSERLELEKPRARLVENKP